MCQPTHDPPESTGPGPYETELEAADDCRVVDLIARTQCRPDAAAEVNQARLLHTCRAARVALGAYDQEILAWLAGHNPETCQVIAGMIARAYEAGQEDSLL